MSGDARHRIAWTRLKPAYAMGGALIVVVAGLLASLYQDRTFRSQRIRELRVQAEILAASVTAALVFDDAPTVQEHVSALAANPEIAAAGVYASNGRLVAWFARGGNGRPSVSASDLPQAEGNAVTVPVTHEVELLGLVHIQAREEPLARRLARHVPMMLLAVMAALLVVFMGAAQSKLHEANAELETRALALVETNARLETEMEERSRAEEALRQSQKMEAVGRMAGGVAHDFNNLLTIIQGNLHLLRRSGALAESEASLVDGADDAAERAGNLVRRLLAFARNQPLTARRVAISELLNSMKDLIVHSAGDDVRVDWALKATWETTCDVNQMENVILNLVINARDAMPSGGTLTIETCDVTEGIGTGNERVQYVQLNIQDTGTGMTDEVRRRAVDPFFTTKPQGKGTGLGLSTAFAFVRQSNGHMNIATAPGAGTTIAILLPRWAGASSPEAA